jgi:hypothetical protein
MRPSNLPPRTPADSQPDPRGHHELPEPPSKLYTARHIEVVASWFSQLDASPLPGQVTGLLYFDLLTRDHAVMAELRDFAFSGDVTISLAR